jgi:hypothetical protein
VQRCGPAVKQIGLSRSRVHRFQPARRPAAAAAAGTGNSANWGECHLRLERVAAERCLATRTTGSGSQACRRGVPRIMAISGPAVNRTCSRSQIPLRCAAAPSLAAQTNVSAWQARFKGGSRARIPVQARVHQLHTSESQRPAQLVFCSASESVTSHWLSGCLPSVASASDFRFIRVTQRTPFAASATRPSAYEPLGFPSHTQAFAVSIPGS